METIMDNRKRLIKLAMGEIQRYEIIYSVDIKGNLTIWGGEPCENHDQFTQKPTEEYLHLYDGWKHGRELVEMEHKMADNIPRTELVRAFLDFREKHPFDGFGILHGYGQTVDDGTRKDRDDKQAVERLLRERNRQYIFELYGEQLPLDFDFSQDYDRRLRSR